MSIRSNKRAAVKTPEPIPVVEAVKTPEPVVEKVEGLRAYVLIGAYSQVSPQGIRFLPNERTPHPPSGWVDANVEAGVLKEVK